MTEQQQQEVKPVTGEQLGRVIMKDNSPANQEVVKALREVPSAVDLVAGKVSKIPDTLVDSATVALFGEKTTNPALAALRTNIETKMKAIKSASEDLTGANADLHAELQSAILQTPGIAEFYKTLDATGQKRFRDNVLSSGLMQANARQAFVEKVTVTAESSQYERVQAEADALRAREKAVQGQVTALDASLATQDIPKVTAEKASFDRTAKTLESQRQSTQGSIDSLKKQMAQREAEYIKKGVPDLGVALSGDPSYKAWEVELKALQDPTSTDPRSLAEINKKINDNESEIAKRDAILQQVTQRGELQKQLDTLADKISAKDQEAVSAREKLLKKVSELGITLDQILPQAAIDAMKQLEGRANEANKIVQEKAAKEKATKAKETGDMAAAIQAKVSERIIRRYQEKVTKKFLGMGKGREVYTINKTKLQADFDQLMQSGSASLADTILNDSSLGLTPEEKKWIGNTENRNKVISGVKKEVFASVSRDAVLNLNLDSETIRNLSRTPDFSEAVNAAIAADATAKEQIEKLTGQKLGGKSEMKQAWEKLPAGGLLGLMLLVLGLLGKLTFAK